MPCIITLILNTFDNSFSSPLPKAKVIKRWVLPVIALFIKLNIVTAPPTTL